MEIRFFHYFIFFKNATKNRCQSSQNIIIFQKKLCFRWHHSSKTAFSQFFVFYSSERKLIVLSTFFMKKILFCKKSTFLASFSQNTLLTKNLISSKWWFFGVSSQHLRDFRFSKSVGKSTETGGVAFFFPFLPSLNKINNRW